MNKYKKAIENWKARNYRQVVEGGDWKYLWERHKMDMELKKLGLPNDYKGWYEYARERLPDLKGMNSEAIANIMMGDM